MLHFVVVVRDKSPNSASSQRHSGSRSSLSPSFHSLSHSAHSHNGCKQGAHHNQSSRRIHSLVLVLFPAILHERRSLPSRSVDSRRRWKDAGDVRMAVGRRTGDRATRESSESADLRKRPTAQNILFVLTSHDKFLSGKPTGWYLCVQRSKRSGRTLPDQLSPPAVPRPPTLTTSSRTPGTTSPLRRPRVERPLLTPLRSRCSSQSAGVRPR